MTLAAGSKLGPYEINSPLGAGGMGEVYRATDTRVDRAVALKVLPEEFFEDEERRRRFEREARTLASLNHPGIAVLYSFEEVSGRHLLAMELVEGEGLEKMIASGPLAFEESLSLAKQIAEALEAAHEKGIVHRDLKPANVKVTADGRVKLLDFGLAKAFDADGVPSRGGSGGGLAESPTLTARATAAGVILGTAAYMSPEQARGKAVDKRTDIWAFGSVLYEMLTGKRAFEGETVSDVLAAVLMKEPDWSALRAPVSSKVRELLRRCLQRDTKQRLRDIGDARIALDEELAVASSASGQLPFEETTASPDPTVGLGSSASRERGGRKSLYFLWAIAAAFAAATGVLALRGRTPEAEPVETRPLTYSGHDWAPAASPDGHLVAFTSDRDGAEKIWLKEIAGGGEAALTAGPDGYPRFSPDGSQIVFIRTEGNHSSAYRMAIVGGEPRKLAEDVAEADWAPDGRMAYLRFSSGDGGTTTVLSVQSGEGGALREAVRVPGRQLLHPRWSADGRRVVCTELSAGGAEKSLFVFDLERDTFRALPTGTNTPSSAAWVGVTDRLVYAASKSPVGSITASAARVVLRAVSGGAARTLFWTPVNADVLDILGPGRLVYDARSARENLGEIALSSRRAAGALRPLTQGSSADRQPTYSPDGEWVLFSSTRNGNLDLWMISTRTGVLRRLTDDEAEDWDPAFSRDGKRILWSSNRTGAYEIWTAASDGSGARAVTRDGLDAENPTETADGQWVVYAQGGGNRKGVWKIRPDGTEATPIVPDIVVLPDVSPDGRWVAYRMSPRADLNEVRVASVADGKRTAFVADLPLHTGFAGNSVGRPRWTPDGRALVFVGQDEKGAYGLFAQDFDPSRDTTATRRPLYGFDSRNTTESFAISPDGSRLAVAVWEQSFDIMLADRVPGVSGRPRSVK